ncbi:hypothetical protein Pfo_009999 [Paulownia fortunei]|nr:hypothetical protein Pfo_009999 [Paulownia fortunei]
MAFRALVFCNENLDYLISNFHWRDRVKHGIDGGLYAVVHCRVQLFIPDYALKDMIIYGKNRSLLYLLLVADLSRSHVICAMKNRLYI